MPTTSLFRGIVIGNPLTLTSLASSTVDAGRQSTAIDCVTYDDVDIEIGGKITLGSVAPTAGTRIQVWLFPSYDGTSFAGGMGATDAAITPVGHIGLGKLVATLPVLVTTPSVTYTWAVPSVAGVFGGALPSKFVVFVTHNTGQALSATAGDHELKSRGINYESA